MRSSPRAAQARAALRHALWAAPLLFLALFYFFPLSRILSVSFARQQVGLAPLLASLQASGVRSVLWFTIWQAALSTLLTLLVGLPGAYLFARYQFRGKALLRALTGIPFVLPTVVVAAAFNALLGPHGWVNMALSAALGFASPPLHFTNTLGAILLAHVFYNTTIMLRMVGDFWSRLDPALGDAAQVLGASRWRAMRDVTLPLLLPAIAAASLLVFIFDFTSFGVILLLGGPRFATLEVEIWYQTVSLFNLPTAAALSVLQLACTFALTAGYTRLSQWISRPLPLRSERAVARPPRTRRARWAVAGTVAFLLILLTSPLAALATHAFVRTDGEGGGASSPLTLEYFRSLSERNQAAYFYVPPTEAVRNSLAYAGATVALALALGLPAAWTLARDNRAINRLLDPLIMLPLGTSAVTLGLGFIIALDRPPLDLRASPLLVPLAHTLVAFPFVVRSLVPALQSIQPSLRQAAAMLGAPPAAVWRWIDLPLVGRAVLVAAVFAFTISIGEFGATALIARPEYPTVPIMIYRFLSRPGALNYGQALALSTLLMAVAGLGILAIERLRIAQVGEF